MFFQKTLKSRAVVKGVGIHSGLPCSLTFVPAPADSGVYFVRKDLPGAPSLQVIADKVAATSYQTTLSGPLFSVATVEHCLSTLAALRVDNAFIELDGPEIPIMDGSAKEFLAALTAQGLVELDQPRQYLVVKEPIEVEDGDKRASVMPYHGLRLSVAIDFPHPVIAKQKLDIDVSEFTFRREIAPARTFGFLKDVEELQKRGLARGGSLDNAIVLDDTKILNPDGLRFSDEFVRHKALDALGDLVTLGNPLLGHVSLYKAGHDLMNKLVKKILSSPQSVRMMELGEGPTFIRL